MKSSYDRRVLITSDQTLRWSGGKPPFRTCELPGLEPSFLKRLIFTRSLLARWSSPTKVFLNRFQRFLLILLPRVCREPFEVVLWWTRGQSRSSWFSTSLCPN